jgi:hypothetical protein
MYQHWSLLSSLSFQIMPMIWMIVTFNQTKQNHSMTLKCIVKHLIGFPHFALSYGPMYEPNKLIAFSNVDCANDLDDCNS